MLIAARAAQGIGTAMVLPQALALLSAAFPPETRGKAMGLFAGITGLAVLGGPVIGGVVVQGLAWQSIFWLNVPIGIALVPLVRRHMAEAHGPRTRSTHCRPGSFGHRAARPGVGADPGQRDRLGIAAGLRPAAPSERR